MGGTFSHEFHFKSQIGEDTLLHCPVCNFWANIDTCESENCPECEQNVKLESHSGIEVIGFTLNILYNRNNISHF